MGALKNKVLCWLGTPQATLLIIASGLLVRMIQLIFFYNIRVDASYQVMATMHLTQGHGASFAEVPAGDLSRTIYHPLINWPPGYSYLLAPFYWLWKGNYIGAGITLDIVCAALLIFSSRAVLKELNVSTALRNVFTLLSSFFVYSFYFIASSDAIAIAFFVTAFYFTLKLSKARTLNVFWVAGLTCCLLLTALIKYLFIPVVFIVPLALLWKSFSTSDNNLKKGAFISLFVLSLACGTFLIWQQLSTGSMGYISQPQRGLFPEHLNDFYPFLVAAWIKPDTVAMTGILNFGTIQTSFAILHLILLVTILLSYWHYLRKTRFRIRTNTDLFLCSSFFISLAITILLAYLSVKVAKEEIWPGVFWTYIEETRYYGIVYIILHILLIYLYSHRKNFRLSPWILFPFLLAWGIESARGGLLVMNRIRLFGKETYSWQQEAAFQNKAHAFIASSKKILKAERVVITGTSYYMNHRVSLKTRVPILYDLGSLNTPDGLQSKKQVMLMAIIEKDKLPQFQEFFKTYQTFFAGQYNDFYFYALNVTPTRE